MQLFADSNWIGDTMKKSEVTPEVWVKYKEERRIWYQKNRQKQLEYVRNWNAKNYEKHISYIKQWQKENPEKVKEYRRFAKLNRKWSDPAKRQNNLSAQDKKINKLFDAMFKWFEKNMTPELKEYYESASGSRHMKRLLIRKRNAITAHLKELKNANTNENQS